MEYNEKCLRNEVCLPLTVDQAVRADVLARARRLILDVRGRPDIGFAEYEVLIAGLMALHDHQKDRADRQATRLATMFARITAKRFQGAVEALADVRPR